MDRKVTLERLVKGAYDLHMHAAPSPFGRAMDVGAFSFGVGIGIGSATLPPIIVSTASRKERPLTFTR